MRVNDNTVPDLWKYRASLDGVTLAFCFEADDAEGYALVNPAIVPDDVPHVVVEGEDDDTGERVAIRMPTIPDWANLAYDWRADRDNGVQTVRLVGAVKVWKAEP